MGKDGERGVSVADVKMLMVLAEVDAVMKMKEESEVKEVSQPAR